MTTESSDSGGNADVPAPDIRIEPGASVDSLALSDFSVTNRCATPFPILHNPGSVGRLSLTNVRLQSKAGGSATGAEALVVNAATIDNLHESGYVVREG